MWKYILKKILLALPVLLGITLIDYFMMSLAGSPLDMMINPRVTEEAVALRASQWGLDESIWMQYIRWLGQVLQGLREEEAALKKRLETMGRAEEETPREKAERWLRFEGLDRFCLQQLVREIRIDREKRVTIRFAFAAPEGAEQERPL